MSSIRNLDEVDARIHELPDGEVAFALVFDKVLSATRVVMDGRTIILAGANNYLGLNRHPEVTAACANATLEFGLGTTASRLASGTYRNHALLEEEFARFFGCPHVLTFSTGYQANLGILSSLCEPGTVSVVDGESHASIMDGCRLGGGRIRRFEHNDVDDLARKLESVEGRRKIVVAEGIYSMSGDVAPLADIAAVAAAHDALLVVDEAHSFGVLGETGRGLAEAAGVEDKVGVIIGTFSKSLGGIGGFAVSRTVNLQHLKYASRPYVFSASLPPGVVDGVRAALHLIATEPALRRRLHANVSALAKRLRSMGLDSGHPDVPIFALPMKTAGEALAVWNSLMEKSVYMNLVLPPASPSANPMLRLSVSAAHTDQDIALIGDALHFAFRRN
jgi:8-amino-7-oxononanoate synthase